MSTIKTAFQNASNENMELVIDNAKKALEVIDVKTGKVVKFKANKTISTLSKTFNADDVRLITSLIVIHGSIDVQMAMMAAL